MFKDEKGPIQRFEWGKYTIGGTIHGEGGLGAGKDIRLLGMEVTKWAERNGHDLTTEMITGVYGRDIEVLIIGNGVNGLLRCPDSVKESIKSKGIEDIRVLFTPDACKLYNDLYHKGRRVAFLAHGTC